MHNTCQSWIVYRCSDDQCSRSHKSANIRQVHSKSPQHQLEANKSIGECHNCLKVSSSFMGMITLPTLPADNLKTSRHSPTIQQTLSSQNQDQPSLCCIGQIHNSADTFDLTSKDSPWFLSVICLSNCSSHMDSCLIYGMDCSMFVFVYTFSF